MLSGVTGSHSDRIYQTQHTTNFSLPLYHSLPRTEGCGACQTGGLLTHTHTHTGFTNVKKCNSEFTDLDEYDMDKFMNMHTEQIAVSFMPHITFNNNNDI